MTRRSRTVDVQGDEPALIFEKPSDVTLDDIDIMGLANLDDLPPIAALVARQAELRQHREVMLGEHTQLQREVADREHHLGHALSAGSLPPRPWLAPDIRARLEVLEAEIRVTQHGLDALASQLDAARSQAQERVAALLAARLIDPLRRRVAALRADLEPVQEILAIHGKWVRLLGGPAAAGTQHLMFSCSEAYILQLESTLARLESAASS